MEAVFVQHYYKYFWEANPSDSEHVGRLNDFFLMVVGSNIKLIA